MKKKNSSANAFAFPFYLTGYVKRIFLVVIVILAFVIRSYGQSLPLTGGTMTGNIIGPAFVQTGSELDMAPMGTITTNGANIGAGANGRSFSSMTQLTLNQYMTIDIGYSVGINVLSFGTHWSGDYRFVPNGFTIAYSNDNSTWTTLYTITGNTNVNPTYTPNVVARYWKLTVTALQSGFTTAQITGFKLVAFGVGSVANNYWNSAFGSLGIFTKTPVYIGHTDELPGNYMLAVNGRMLATEIIVQNYVDWPDYVFKPNYNLKPLSEVKAYIEQNSHLPEIPAASEIKKEGMNVGEMNKLLLKKVEELTLYLIQKDDAIKALKQNNDKVNQSQQQQIDELKKQIANLITHK